MKSFSIIYNNYSNKFDLISDCPQNDIFYLSNNTNKIEASLNYFSSNYSLSICYFSELSFDSISTKIFYSDLDSELSSTLYSNSESISDYIDIDSFLLIYENKPKEEIINDFSEIMKKIEIGKEYTIKGEDFIIIIKPTNMPYYGNSTYVNLSQCENILRNASNISLSSILTIFNWK